MGFLFKTWRQHIFAGTVLLFCWNSFWFMLPPVKTNFLLLKLFFAGTGNHRSYNRLTIFATTAMMGSMGECSFARTDAFFCYNWTGDRRTPGCGDHHRSCGLRTGAVAVAMGSCNRRRRLLHARSRRRRPAATMATNDEVSDGDR